MKGIFQKMETRLEDVVQYQMNLEDISLNVNKLIGEKISIQWMGKVKCICGKIMKKFYRSGFCYQCYWTSPMASQSIFKPELCTAHLNIEERDLAWEKKFQLAPHYVYLANSSGVKVGITRKSEKETRWMDQGASQAILFAEVPNRRFSGDIEVSLKKFVNDITNWRKMLSGEPKEIDLIKLKKDLTPHIPKELSEYVSLNDTVTDIKYPVTEYPKKVKSIKLEKEEYIEGKLNGIKGQYLLLENNRVFNVRSHEGFIINFSHTKASEQTSLF